MIAFEGVSKSFGATRANRNVSFSVERGEIVGLIGANGAGKSTLIQIMSGMLAPDEGEIKFDGETVASNAYGRADAQHRGVRTVFQELSLCSNLSAIDNFYLEQSQLSANNLSWRRRLGRVARASVLDVFTTATNIDVAAPVGALPIAERQMIEIARAASDPRLRLLILDEPTSSLDASRSAELFAFVKREAATGVSFVFVTHKLREVLELATKIVVMRNGQVVWRGPVEQTSIRHLIEVMGGEVPLVSADSGAKRLRADADAPAMLGLDATDPMNGLGHALELRRGDVVGLAGLDGQGQKELLRALYFRRANYDLGAGDRPARVNFVSGDRAREGVFAGASILWNATVSRVAATGWFSMISERDDLVWAQPGLLALGVAKDRLRALITEFSGGNQQKALMLRPLVAQSECILLDDPTRGVDVQTKGQIYKLIEDGAREQKLFVWFTSEDLEFNECTRILVMANGRIVEELTSADMEDKRHLDAAFSRVGSKQGGRDPGRFSLSALSLIFDAAPFLALAAAYALIVYLNRNALSMFGLDLILTSAVPLVFITIGQMFIMGGSQIDLGIGSFAALINVVTALYLNDNPTVGVVMLVLSLATYILMGAVIQIFQMPALVVTLGASFVWLGLAHTLLPTPGGNSPGWLSQMFGFSLGGLPASLVLIVVSGFIAFALNRSRFGVVLRGFGDNPRAMAQSGWSPLLAQIGRYAVAGVFVMVGGSAMTALSGAADANAGSTLTLLSIAALIVGRCALTGGIVAPLGGVAGAVTLSLVGALLATLGVDTNFSAAVQGSLLLAILLLQTVTARPEP